MNATYTPEYIQGRADFDKKIRLGETTESLVLEFKRDYGERRSNKSVVSKKAQKELCRDISQFANSFGGCLLIGIEEGEDKTKGYRIAQAVKSVEKPDVLKAWITQAQTNYLVPSTIKTEIVIIDLDDACVVAVNIWPSVHLVAVYDRFKHTIQYLHRTSLGKSYMNPDESERHLMDGSRAAKLAIIQAREKALSRRGRGSSSSVEVVISGGLWSTEGYEVKKTRPVRIKQSGQIELVSLEEMYFELRIPVNNRIISTHVPYGVVEEAWMESDGCIALLLSVRLRFVNNRDGFILEPWNAT